MAVFRHVLIPVDGSAPATRAATAVPDEGIVAYARRRGCGAIFLGSHGHRGIKRLLLGSVASQVLARAEVPVVVYR